MKTVTLLATYPLALVAVLFWWMLVMVAVHADESVRADWDAGKPFDHFDPALDRLDRIHAELFGSDE